MKVKYIDESFLQDLWFNAVVMFHKQRKILQTDQHSQSYKEFLLCEYDSLDI